MRQILCCEVVSTLNFPINALFVFNAFEPPEAELPVLPTEFLAPSFHLSGTANLVTFD